MINSLTVSFTLSKGAELDIGIRDAKGNLLHTGPAILATGQTVSVIPGDIAEDAGIRQGEPYAVVAFTSEDETPAFGVTFVLSHTVADRRVRLGMDFIRHWRVCFDGENKIASLDLDPI